MFGADIDFSQLIRVYASDEATRERHSPGVGIDAVFSKKWDNLKAALALLSGQLLLCRLLGTLPRWTNKKLT